MGPGDREGVHFKGGLAAVIDRVEGTYYPFRSLQAFFPLQQSDHQVQQGGEHDFAEQDGGGDGNETGYVLPPVVGVARQTAHPRSAAPADQQEQLNQGDAAPNDQKRASQRLKDEHLTSPRAA